ncbi:GYDIA family GHMP kinase [Flavobacterium sp. TMP13]|uniref:GYDIA family GHMP kinase n=1 Tax=Flavobacterium sp. TMP13 TaxID=3425950 RepID=UPI003D76CE0A
MQQTYYSNGKLLITGEYLVLDGAIALALPTKTGQNLVISPGENQQIQWKSYDFDGSIWFENNFSFDAIIANKKPEIETIESTLINILHEAYLLDPNFIKTAKGYQVETHLTFPRKWGLGTSSTLLNNIAQWAKIDAFTLLKNSFGGSGYDIACAQNDEPITYQLIDGEPKVTTVSFEPYFTANIHFIYLNKKQSSKAAINAYYNHKSNNLAHNIATINNLTEKTLTAETAKDFAKTLQQHEIFMSNVLELHTVKEHFFSDFDGVIKSLGAWGGDFVMAISKENPKQYFTDKGYDTILAYDEMILL